MILNIFQKVENWRDACLKITNKPAPSLFFLSVCHIWMCDVVLDGSFYFRNCITKHVVSISVSKINQTKNNQIKKHCRLNFHGRLGKTRKPQYFLIRETGGLTCHESIARNSRQKKNLYTFSGYGNRIVSVDRPINGLDWAQVLLYQFVREETPKKAPKWPAVLAQWFFFFIIILFPAPGESFKNSGQHAKPNWYPQHNSIKRKEKNGRRLFPKLSQLNRTFFFLCGESGMK